VVLLGVGALLAMCAGALYEKRFGAPQHPLVSNTVQCAVGFACTLPLALLMEDGHIDWSLPLIAVLAYLVIGNSLIAISIVVVVGLLVVWRPLTFASVDADVAAARGVSVQTLSIVFMLLLGLAVAVSVQVVGSLLVLSILVTPAAAALRVSSSPIVVPLLSMLFAVLSLVGGIMLALGGSVPISPYVTTISFAIYVICRIIAASRTRRGISGRKAVA
jgi:ABC-type Mn2+/Zn2+ transport system permease subunit